MLNKDEAVGGLRHRKARHLLFGLCVFAFSHLATASDRKTDSARPAKGDWLLRGSVLQVRSLTQSTDIPAIGGSVESPDKLLPGLDINYFLTDNWALEFQGGRVSRCYSVTGSQLGSFSVGQIDSAALTLALQYHFRLSESAKPYLGLGANYTWTRDVRPAQNIPDFDVEPIMSAVVAAGTDFKIAPNWVLNASVKYFISPAYEFKGSNFNATVRVNTLVLGTGIGYYF